MARIKDSGGRTDEDSGYTRLFGNNQLGKLFSKVQAAVIRNGNELEDLLWEATPYQASFDAILRNSLSSSTPSIQVVSAKKIAQYDRTVPRTDLLIRDNLRGELSVVELKDGDTFDTKKADGELASAQAFTTWISRQINLPVRYYFCSFNQFDKTAIIKGIKSRFGHDQVLTGQELCRLIGVDYTAIRLGRQQHQVENREYFIQQMLTIPEMKELIETYLSAEI